MKEPRQRSDAESASGGTNWTMISLIAGIILLVLAVAYFGRAGNPDQDKLTNAVVATNPPPATREKLCDNSATFDLIKRELFRRAGEIRGGDQAAFDRLAGIAVVRMENPVMESQDSATGAANCSGSLSVDLPPGVSVAGGHQTLTADVDYTVSAPTEGSGTTVALRNVDVLVNALATATATTEQASPSTDVTDLNEVAPTTQPAAPKPVPAPPRTDPLAPRPSVRASFDCTTPRSHGETIVCGDPSLASLDRQTAAQYSDALQAASPDQRALLRHTARRFQDYRDRCNSTSCVSAAYTGRLREIRDIMEDRWQPSR